MSDESALYDRPMSCRIGQHIWAGCLRVTARLALEGVMRSLYRSLHLRIPSRCTSTETEEIAGAAARERSNRVVRLSHKTSMKTIVSHFRHTIYRIYTAHYFYNIVLYPLHFSMPGSPSCSSGAGTSQGRLSAAGAWRVQKKSCKKLRHGTTMLQSLRRIAHEGDVCRMGRLAS